MAGEDTLMSMELSGMVVCWATVDQVVKVNDAHQAATKDEKWL